ncbi:MAG: toll/interleukin-1 receptor domain-containing protein [Candidatus Aminicenantes bacterium]|nr:MAG: toll/interleukin-1 receptor domain-containing protein [Candidatus Aminicenantes bacterium]
MISKKVITDKKPTIFVSYSSKDKALVDLVDRDFRKKLGIILLRDERELDYRESIYMFMKKVRQVDYVLIMLSDAFLKSRYCMYEMTELMKDENYKDRILPIKVEEIDIFSLKGRLEYTHYWKDEFQKFEKALKPFAGKLDRSVLVSKELEEANLVKNIYSTINEFLNHIRSIRLEQLDELQKQNYRQMKKILRLENMKKTINMKFPGVLISVLAIFMAGLILGGLIYLKSNNKYRQFPSEILATFEDDTSGLPLAKTNWGQEWSKFGDSEFNCRSVSIYSIKKILSESNNYAMWIDVNLPECEAQVYRYTGIVAYLGANMEKFDLSLYSGVSIDFGISKLEGSLDIFVQLVDTKTKVDGAWHVAPIEFNYKRIGPKDRPKMTKISIPFSKFIYPSWYKPEKVLPLYLKEIYKIAIIFRQKIYDRKPVKGIFIIDNIRFYKDR